MNILFIYLRHSENPQDSTLTKDISDEFSKNGHKVFVATLLEKKYKRKTECKKENGYTVLRVKSGNYFDSPGKIEKGITALTMPFQLKKEIIKYFGKERIDLIFTHTPFVANEYLINGLKKHFNAKAMLHLWDIFPQNALDIGLMNKGVLSNFFEKKEKKMYKVFDYIGCMSEGNKKYMQEKFTCLNSLFVLKNWGKGNFKEFDKVQLRKKYNFDINDFLVIFGGNMGKPQKLSNIIHLAKELKDYENIKFIFVGKGTEEKMLKELSKDLNNVFFYKYIPREEYEEFTGMCDLGIVSLDERFTVPNFPSKTTDYFKLGLPIFASLDSCAKKDYGVFLQDISQGGLFSEAGNLFNMKEVFLKLYNNKELREKMGRDGRRYYEENLGVEKAYKTIMERVGGN
jgi:glycosyltransferase involved in cell wall biosynthesis